MKNFKLILAAVAIVASSLSVSSCKKGANDPAVSFRSRDARLVGKWKLTGMNHKQVSTSVSGSTVTITETTTTYDNGVQTIKSGGSASTSKFDFFATFEKGGEYGSYSDYFNTSGQLTSHNEGEGAWSWVNNNKNKSVIAIFQFTSGDLIANVGGGGLGNLEVDQLKNNDLILTRHIRVKQASGANSNETVIDQQFTFEREKD